MQGFYEALERFAKSVRGSLQTCTDLGQFPRREVDALLLRVRALANGIELVCHLLDRVSQVGKLTGDQGGVLLLRHLLPGFYVRVVPTGILICAMGVQ